MKRSYDIYYKKAVLSWDEALPLGNGKLGSLVYGDGPLKVAVDRIDLWDERTHPCTRESGFNFQNLVRLSKSEKDEDWKERNRLFERITSAAYPTKITAGRIEIDFGVKTENIRSKVLLNKAIAEISIDGDPDKRAEIFLSATDLIGVMRVRGARSFDIHIPSYLSGNDDGDRRNDSGLGENYKDGCLHYPRACVERDGEYMFYSQKTNTDFCFGTVALIKKKKNFTEVYYTAESNKDADDFISYAKQMLFEAARKGYAKLKRDHVSRWKNYWEKSDVSVKDELIEKTYYRSWYLFASCSRKGFYPMPLQGVWTADDDSLPPWKGDYHHDTNTQLSYQSYLKANRTDEGECFIDYLWAQKDNYRKFAKEFYGVDGMIIPSSSTLNGKPVGGWAQYSFSPTMTIWAAQSFDEYRLYTGDKDFVATKAYPFFAEVEKAIFSLLEEKDGKYYLPVSSSPEIFNNSRKACLEPNSNFDLALLKYLYKTLSEYCDILGISGDRYRDILGKFDDFAVRDGKYPLIDKKTRLDFSHRHFSHLMFMYPLHLVNYDTEEHKALYNGAIEDIERLGTGLWVGFSFAMCAQIYAMALNGNGAYEKLRAFCDGFVAENGFHLNEDFMNKGYSSFHNRPFTMEASFGFCDALQEMLLQEHRGFLHVFPAVPDSWLDREISFENFLSYGGITVSAKAKGGKTERIKLRIPRKSDIKIMNTFGSDPVFAKTEKFVSSLTAKDGFFTLDGIDGEVVIESVFRS